MPFFLGVRNCRTRRPHKISDKPWQHRLRRVIPKRLPTARTRTKKRCLDQQRIRRAFEVAIEHRPDDQDPLKKIYGPMHAAITRLRDGTPIEDVTDALGLALFKLVSPQTKAELHQLLSPRPSPGAGCDANGPTPQRRGTREHRRAVHLRVVLPCRRVLPGQ